jgi:DNA-binding transcriptional LysR family regulator
LAFDYDLIDIRLIVNVVDTASLTRGAERSHMSAPAASARLKKVQESLNSQLFYRSTQGLVPTAAGHAFLRHARLVLQQLEQLDNELRQRAREPGGCVRVHVNTLSMGESIPAAIEQFLLAFPGVNVDLHERASADIARALKQGQADVGILSSDLPDDSLVYRPYRTEHLVLVTPLQHALAGEADVAFARTLAFDYVGLSEHAALQAFITRMAAGEGIPMKLRIQANNLEALCGLVESGVGVGVIPASAARRHARQQRIAVVPLRDAWAVRELRIAVRDMDALTAPALALIDVLSRQGEAG